MKEARLFREAAPYDLSPGIRRDKRGILLGDDFTRKEPSNYNNKEGLSMRLKDKVAIVTGAGGGIGRATALLLAAEGASVLVNDLGTRPGADAQAVAEEIEAKGGVAQANRTSATWDGAEAIIGQAMDSFGRIDILINNATLGTLPCDLWSMPETGWDRTFDVNVKGYFAMIRRATPHLARQGGAIVNMSSGAGFGHPAMAAYATAKEGVIGLTRTVAQELGRFGIRCNAVRPLALGVSSDDYRARIAKWMKLITLTVTPGGKPSEADRATPDTHPPSKVAPMMVWLCTDAASGVNGRTFHVRGDTIALLSEPSPEQIATRTGGWTLDELDHAASTQLVSGLKDAYRLEDHPELQAFSA